MSPTPITDDLVEKLAAAEKTLRRQARSGDPDRVANYVDSALTAIIEAIRKLESRGEQ